MKKNPSLRQSLSDALTCIAEEVNFKTMLDDIEKGKQKGNVDVVINKYCTQREKINQCVLDFTESFEPCLDEEEKDHKDFYVNMTHSALNTICSDDGKRIEREKLIGLF